ncbi:MAG: hypothetical protein JWR27_2115 [Aeromicrobium sp.]|jgi:hypothetical protein|nr:hypothetical protein [Aeromicrobium sp.]
MGWFSNRKKRVTDARTEKDLVSRLGPGTGPVQDWDAGDGKNDPGPVNNYVSDNDVKGFNGEGFGTGWPGGTG